MSRPIRLGLLTPSSNTVLEPLSTAMVAGLPGVSLHFSRFRVTEIALSDQALAQFDPAPVLHAAALLADARVDAIAWSGTSASWLGFDRDVALCRQIQDATGIPATSSVLALNEALARTGVRRLGLVTPYRDDVQALIVANYAELGIACVAERHLGLHDNFSFAYVTEAQLERMAHEVADAALRCPVYDSVATALWKALRLAGGDPAKIAEWGSLFALAA